MKRLEDIIRTIGNGGTQNWKKTKKNDGSVVAVFIEDVHLRIETSLDLADRYRQRFAARWAHVFDREDAQSYYYNVFYGSSLVHRVVLVSLNGGSTLLPLPRSPNEDRVPLLPYRVAQIFDSSGKLDEHLQRAGLTVEAAVVTFDDENL